MEKKRGGFRANAGRKKNDYEVCQLRIPKHLRTEIKLFIKIKLNKNV